MYDMEKLISIIIPTYNMENYLNYCLSSLVIERKLDLLEVIVVNDGSSDLSLEIAHKYAVEHPSTFKIIDKENGNYGSCINAGLAAASGKYVKILDADDSFDKHNLEEYIIFLSEADADLIISDFDIVNADRKFVSRKTYNFLPYRVYSMEQICVTQNFKDMQMHAVTYRRENLIRSGYFQTEGISYTDQQWIFEPMSSVRTVMCFNKPVYQYLIGREGQTMDPAVKLRSMSHLALCVQEMLKSYLKLKSSISECLDEYLLARIIPLSKEVYVTLMINYSEESKKLLLQYDAALKDINEEYYVMIASKEISSCCGFRYIKYWRSHPEIPIRVLKIFSWTYALMLRTKVR